MFCQKCGSATHKITMQVFRNGSERDRVDCANCGAYIGFAPKHKPKVSLKSSVIKLIEEIERTVRWAPSGGAISVIINVATLDEVRRIVGKKTLTDYSSERT